MKTMLIAIGNSRGIRIPKAILEQCHFKKELDLNVEGDSIILRPLKSKPRQHWGEAFKMMHQKGDDKLIIDDGVDINSKDWEW